MSYNHGSSFNTEYWYHTTMDKRTRQALQERQAAFEAKCQNAGDDVLLTTIKARAGELGYTPFPVEVIGAALICRRFGSWHRALYAAELSPPRGASKLEDSKLYKAEYLRQQKLYRAEKQEKKEFLRQRNRERVLRDEERRQKKASKTHT